jgi:hypothetical protein
VVRARIKSWILPTAIALAVALSSGAAGARGGGGHGGGGRGGSGHFGGGSLASGTHAGGGSIFLGRQTVGAQAVEPFSFHGGGSISFGPFGGRYGGYLYVGPTSVWDEGPHWGSGFWAAGPDGWAWYTGPWWVSPQYPGWVWMGPPWVWDGERMVSQEGYWTTASMPEGAERPPFVEPSNE